MSELAEDRNVRRRAARTRIIELRSGLCEVLRMSALNGRRIRVACFDGTAPCVLVELRSRVCGVSR